MNIYNTYIKIPDGGPFESEIAFVEISDDFDKNFVYRNEQWVMFGEKYKNLTGFYQIDIGVDNFYGKSKTDFLKAYGDKITDIITSHRHYAYVKVIDDKFNPHLNGQVMIFRYGRRIYDILNRNKSKVFCRTFRLRMEMRGGYPCYDNSVFTENQYYIRDASLSIQNIPSLRKLDIVKGVERKFKLEKILKKQLDIKMRKFVCSPFGEEVDLDNPETFSYLPDDTRELDNMMFKEIGQALVYMDFFHPELYKDGIDGGQRKRIMERIKYFTDYRRDHYNDVMWLKEQVFLFQDETENMC